MSTQLCLGTAQFGLPYGITNIDGQVHESEVRSILNLASQVGITYLDTAQAYGSAEEVVGRCIPPSSNHRLISKLSAHARQETWEVDFQASLKRLSIDRLDSFLLHSSSDLRGPSGEKLLNWLEGLRRRGLVDRIGISIYQANELKGLPLDRLQIIQLPLSIYDQRLLNDGTIDFLHSLGIAVHARSLFLQGLLLQRVELWPDFLSRSFREHHSRFQQHLISHGLTSLEAAFIFVRSCQSLEALLIGVLTVNELKQILAAWTNSFSSNASDGLEFWGWDDPADLDPRCWPSR
jgi:aryl-alcohol dehydrogenase-like predicted oxidoreductase